MLQAFCDGSITGSHWAKAAEKDSLPHAWSGWWVRDEDHHILQWRSIDLGEAVYMSANVAEYMAVRSALFWLCTSDQEWLRAQVIEINSDSQTVIRQLTGQYNCYDAKLLLLRDACLKLARNFPYVKDKWIPQEENRAADMLSKALQKWGRQPSREEVERGEIKKPARRRRAAAVTGSGS
jgi:ribonuclease HI